MQLLFDRVKEEIAGRRTAALAEHLQLPERQVSFALGSLTPALLVCLTEKHTLDKIPFPENIPSFADWASDILLEKKIPVTHAIAAFSGLSPANVEAILPVAAEILALCLHEMSISEMEAGASSGAWVEKQSNHAWCLLPASVAGLLIAPSEIGHSKNTQNADSWPNALLWLLVLFFLLLLLAGSCQISGISGIFKEKTTFAPVRVFFTKSLFTWSLLLIAVLQSATGCFPAAVEIKNWKIR
ncbi:MAG: hypothetical protein SFV22_06050 [Saprospiraceae bacterium]|nr:hypothetical protein [Saprospiraceae bacterium]